MLGRHAVETLYLPITDQRVESVWGVKWQREACNSRRDSDGSKVSKVTDHVATPKTRIFLGTQQAPRLEVTHVTEPLIDLPRLQLKARPHS